MEYKKILDAIRIRLKQIEDVSLVDDDFNAEYVILKNMQNELYKLIKIKGRQNDN